ncbi:MAG: photosystem II cytochrome PsbV2 [Actinomycetota bacterium]
MRRQAVFVRCLLAIFVTWLGVFAAIEPAQAATVDPYIVRYLKVTEPIELNLDSQGQTRLFSGEELSAGKHLFEKHCLNCHVGGATLPVPTISLSLSDLQGATPPRDNIDGLVTYLREPKTYDGSEDNYWCRQVPETWMPRAEIEKLAAFVLRAAQKAPGWGVENFEE